MYLDRLDELRDCAATQPGDPAPVLDLPPALGEALCPEALRGATNWSSWSRGVDLLRERPPLPLCANGRVFARVPGSGAASYAADLTMTAYLTRDTSYLSGSCTCPVGQNGKRSLCKHAISLGLAVLGYHAAADPAVATAEAETSTEEVLRLLPQLRHEQLVELLAALVTQQPGVLLTVAQRVADLHAGGTLAWGRTVVAAAAETLHEPDSRFADALTNCLDRAEAAGPAVSGPLARLVLDTVGGVYDVAPKGMRNHELPLVISQAVRLHQEACAVGAVDAAELASFLIGWSFTNTGMLDAIEVADWLPLAGADTVKAVRAEHTAAEVRLAWLSAEPVPAATGARHTRVAQVDEATNRVGVLARLLAQLVAAGGRTK